MDYSRPELADRLAAEYALGTLRGPARRRFENLMLAHPALRRATQDWHRRLEQLAASTPAVEPSPQVWPAIQGRLFGREGAHLGSAPAATGRSGRNWWSWLGLWQGLAGTATAAAIALGVALSQPTPVQPPIVVVLGAPPDVPAGAVIQPATFVASVGGDGRSLVIKPLSQGQKVAVNKALELWAVPPKGAPRSLGLVAQDGTTTVVRTELLKDTAAFAVTVEPPGGAPSGKATGPIVSLGQLQI